MAVLLFRAVKGGAHSWKRSWFSSASLGLMCMSFASCFALMSFSLPCSSSASASNSGLVAPFTPITGSMFRSLAGESRVSMAVKIGEERS